MEAFDFIVPKLDCLKSDEHLLCKAPATISPYHPFDMSMIKNLLAKKLPLLNYEKHPKQGASDNFDTRIQTCSANSSLNQFVLKDISCTETLWINNLEDSPDNVGLVNHMNELMEYFKWQSAENAFAESDDDDTAYFSLLKAFLSEMPDGVPDKANSVHDMEMRFFERRLTKLENLSKKMTEKVVDIESVIERKYGPGLLKRCSSIVKQTDNIQKFKYHPFPQKNDLFTFEMPKTCGWGPRSMAIGQGLRRASVELKAHFTVYVYDHFGNPKRKGGDLVEVLILNGRGVSVQYVKVKDCGDGSYRVTYIPEEESRHSINITVNGVEVPSSPFEFDVREVCMNNKPEQLYKPSGIYANYNRRIVSDRSDDYSKIFDDVRGYLRSFPGKPLSEFIYRPKGAVIDKYTDGENRIVVANKGNRRVQTFNLEGEVISTFEIEGGNLGQPHYPWDVAVEKEDDRRVQLFTGTHLDYKNLPMQVLDQWMKIIGCHGHGSNNFLKLQGVAVGCKGSSLVTDSKN